MTKTAIFYGRVSTEEQSKHGYSIEAQQAEAIKWAKRNNFEIKEFFVEEGKTGTNLNRPELKRMLKYLKQNKISTVLVWKLDRLSRNTGDFFGQIQPSIFQSQTTIASIQENFLDIKELSSLLVAVYIGQAEDEVRNIKQRTKTCMQNRVKQGYFLGKAPLGYKNETDKDKHGIIVPDPEKAGYIKRAFELYATGEYSYKAVSEELYKYGLTDTHGKAYPVRKIEWILKNPIYYGKIKYKEIECEEGKHTPLISKELFYRVQLLFRNNTKTKTKNENFIYSNYIKCAKCGCSLVAEAKTGAHNSGNYVYYHCTNYKKVHERQKNISGKEIDKAIIDVLNSFDITENDINLVKEEIAKSLDELKGYEATSLATLEKRNKELTMIMKGALEKQLTGKIKTEQATFDEMYQKWQLEKEQIAIRMSELKLTEKERNNNLKLLLDFTRKMKEIFVNATSKEKRLIVATITDEIKYYDGILTVKLKPIFEKLRKRKEIELLKKNYRTLKIVETTTLQKENKNKKNITHLNNYRTLNRLTGIKKEPHIETLFVSGAGDGNRTHEYRNHNPRP